MGRALVDRMREWLTQSAPVDLKSVIKKNIVETIDSLPEKGVSDQFEEIVKPLYDSFDKPFRYRSYNPVTEMARHIIGLERKGKIEQASALRQYINMNSALQKKQRRIPVVSRSNIMPILVK